MFDQSTSELIQSTPFLDGLNRESLPDRLTEAFAKIAATRACMREMTDDSSGELEEMIGPIRRLAYTNEALVAVLPERGDRRSASFVAAMAHQIQFNADFFLQKRRPEVSLGIYAISSDVAAMLLFLIAEATADAAEMAKSLDLKGLSPIERTLVNSLTDLATGQLSSLIDRPMPAFERDTFQDIALVASRALYLETLHGVHELAKELLAGSHERSSESALDIFNRVKEACVSDTFSLGDHALDSPASMFSGPHHLASLLIAVAGDLYDSAVTNVPAPPGVDQSQWIKSTRSIAQKRPYLWRNHREAIDNGYLVPGVSAAVGFPTGAGKSTLAELKINVTLLQNKSTIFLCPTHALVEQTVNGLQNAFPNSKVQGERRDIFGIDFEEDGQPEIFVMTPEACLSQLSIDSTAFINVGLLVFDECHLLHPSQNPNDRRAIDAMLCVINLPLVAADLDILLLSAMMKNTDDIADWISELTSRTCLSLTLSWKPTRQLRGSVVYQQKEVNELDSFLMGSKKHHVAKRPPVAVKRGLTATPFALFSLKQAWRTNNARDYTLVRLLGDEVTLAANDYWRLTPNAGAVSSSIAAASVQSDIRTLVFFQTIKNAASAAKQISKKLDQTPVELTQRELRLAEIASLELGGNTHMYLRVESGKALDSAIVHHGLLLPEERSLCESLYKRPNGIKALTATSTLAQGMNLPSELVIIAEDSRFDEATERREILQAQELLNAAGRAGRAGDNASGVVLVIPGKVVGIDLEDAKIGKHWSSLREIFGQSDQCLEIDDPLSAVLDRIYGGTDAVANVDHYAIARLARGEDQEAQVEALSRAIKCSLSAHFARKNNNLTWIDERIEASTAFFQKQSENDDSDTISQQLAASLGLSTELVIRLTGSLDLNGPKELDPTIPVWRRWFFKWLRENPDLLEHVFRSSSLSELFGKKYSSLASIEEKAKFAIPLLGKLAWLWMKGAPLSEMESAFGKEKKQLKECNNARRFVIRIVPELSFLFGFPALLHERLQEEHDTDEQHPVAVSQLRQCLKQGFNSHEKAALNHLLRGQRLSRIEIHRHYQEIKPYLDSARLRENWDQTIDRVNSALDAWASEKS